jgi:hypothetical protein
MHAVSWKTLFSLIKSVVWDRGAVVGAAEIDSWQRKFVPTQWELKTVLSGINGRKHEVDHSVPSSACNFNSILLLSSITQEKVIYPYDIWGSHGEDVHVDLYPSLALKMEAVYFFLKRLFLPSLPVCVSYTLYQNTFGVNNSFFFFTVVLQPTLSLVLLFIEVS